MNPFRKLWWKLLRRPKPWVWESLITGYRVEFWTQEELMDYLREHR